MSPFLSVLNEIQQATNIGITAHKSPDGDSIGSSLALYHFINKLGKKVMICHPDPAPSFLMWMEDIHHIVTYKDTPEIVETVLKDADLIFCLDYNASDRLGEGMHQLLDKATAKKIMIDHHLNPESFPNITISETQVCSTCQLIFELIDQTNNLHLLDTKIGSAIYLGILTDSGSFRFPSVQPRTHEVLAKLLAVGVQHHLIHEQLNDNNTFEKLKLQGFAMSEKLEILDDYKIAIVSLTEDELNDHHYLKGDTDGIVNMPLSIKGIRASIFLYEKDGQIKISFRSKGKENAVNIMAADHFNGGGHANASGGMSQLHMSETLKKLKAVIPQYFNKVI